MNENLIEKARDYIENKIGRKRYEHSIRVSELSKKLADYYDYSIYKAELAALLHDSAKGREDKLLLKGYDVSDIILKEDIEIYRPIIHAPLAAEIARKEFDIDDEEIINSIIYHTTGRPDMSLLEKIILVADAAEPGRDYKAAMEIRELAFNDLNLAVVKALDTSLLHCIDNGRIINPLTILSRNYYIKEMSN